VNCYTPFTFTFTQQSAHCPHMSSETYISPSFIGRLLDSTSTAATIALLFFSGRVLYDRECCHVNDTSSERVVTGLSPG